MKQTNEYFRILQEKKRIENIAAKKFRRICSECDSEIIYSTKQAYYNAVERNSICKSCHAKNQLRKIHEEIAVGIRPKLFQGSHHSEATKDRLKKSESWKKSQQHPNWINRKIPLGSDNHMFGKHNDNNVKLKKWSEKYGEEEAQNKLIKYKAKLSANTSGKNNPMYGKPAPKGSGGGWCGWYDTHFFRSLTELSLMVNLDRFGFIWESAEKKEFRISLPNGKNYFPDFLVSNKYLIECKPKRLINSADVQQKSTAAKIFCQGKNLKYKIMSPAVLRPEQLSQFIESGKVKLTDKWSKRWLDLIESGKIFNKHWHSIYRQNRYKHHDPEGH